MIVNKKRPTPDQFYQRLTYMVARFGHLPGFRRPPLGKHAGGREPKPLILESQLARLGEADALPRRQRSARGERKRALQTLCDLQVAVERRQRQHLAAVARGECEPRELDEFLADKEASREYKVAMAVLHPEMD